MHYCLTAIVFFDSVKNFDEQRRTLRKDCLDCRVSKQNVGNAKSYQIVEGSSNIQKLIIAGDAWDTERPTDKQRVTQGLLSPSARYVSSMFRLPRTKSASRSYCSSLERTLLVA